jgi:beta-1,4-mannosyltransferase
MRQPLLVAAEPAFRTRQANPYNARLYFSMSADEARIEDLTYLRLLTQAPDIVHLHWPDLTFLSGGRRWLTSARLTLFSLALGAARLRGTRVVWTAHNLIDHEERSTPRLRALYQQMLRRQIDGIICLSHAGLEDLRAGRSDLAAVPAWVVPHGHYREDYDFTISRAAARELLGVGADAPLVVSLGQIRRYKNVPALIRAFRRLPDGTARLVVAGRAADDATRDEVTAAAEGDPRIRCEFVHLSPERMALWLAAADLVALPYRRIDNSGSAILALSAHRAVLAPRLGALSELQDQIGPEWVRLHDGELDVATLESALLAARTLGEGRTPDLTSLDWPPIAEATLAVYRSVSAAPRARADRGSASTPPDSLPNRGDTVSTMTGSTPVS